MLPFREEVLSSLVCCDVIGFHLFEHARHFYTSCERIFGIKHEFTKGGICVLRFHGRKIMIKIMHIGIDVKDI